MNKEDKKLMSYLDNVYDKYPESRKSPYLLSQRKSMHKAASFKNQLEEDFGCLLCLLSYVLMFIVAMVIYICS